MDDKTIGAQQVTLRIYESERVGHFEYVYFPRMFEVNEEKNIVVNLIESPDWSILNFYARDITEFSSKGPNKLGNRIVINDKNAYKTAVDYDLIVVVKHEKLGIELYCDPQVRNKPPS